MFNKLLYNPAYAGNRDALAASAVYRNQWLGIEGAPVTLNFNVHTPFAGDRAGLGLSVVADKIGVVNTTFATLSYNYRVPVGETAKLGLGISGRIEHGRMDFNQLNGYDQGDDFIMSDVTNQMKPNFGFGVFLSDNNYYLGVSMPTVLENTHSVDALLQYQFTPNLRAGMAFDFTTSELNANTAGGYDLMVEYIFNRKDRQLTNIRYF